MWAQRLKELGSWYGALPGHAGLWESALNTKDDLLARLAVVHMVLEGRGLDVTPMSLKKLEKANDTKSLDLLKIIYRDEITHVGSGITWFKYICHRLNTNNINDKKFAINMFHKYVKQRFSGPLKPPFNDQAREKAGFTKEWYMPLVNTQ